MTKKFAIVLALFVISIVCCAGCIGPGEEPVDPVDPVVPVDPVDPVTPVDPVDPEVPVEEYSVMFMLNYGDAGAYSAETVKAGETVSKPANPTRSGYAFKGWFTASEGGAEYDFTQAVNADVTLYAQWSKKSSSSSSGSSSGGSSTPSCSHDWGAGEVTTEPTCEETGIKTYTCSKCGETKEETLLNTGHSWGTPVTIKEPSCFVAGEMVTVCANCGEQVPAVMSQLTHDFVAGTPVEPTCDADGYTLYTCSYGCGTTEKRDIASATGHNMEVDSTIPPCGGTKYVCSVCSAVKVDGTNVQHQTDDEYTSDPTNHWKVCTSCSAVVEEKDEHDFDADGKCSTCDYQCSHGYAVTSVDETQSPAVATLTCSLCQNTTTEEYVAKVGTAYYTDLSTAITDAGTTGTLVLLADVDTETTISEAVTINVNDKTAAFSYSAIGNIKILATGVAGLTVTLDGKTVVFGEKIGTDNLLPVIAAYTKEETRYSTIDIYTEEGLMWTSTISKNGMVTSEGKLSTITIMNNLDMSGFDYDPINCMWLTIDGKENTISNLNCLKADSVGRSGFLAYGGGCTINDLTLQNVKATGTQVGAFVGSADGTKLVNCKLTGTVELTWEQNPAGEDQETWSGIGAVAGVSTSSADNYGVIIDGATVTIKMNGMTTEAPKVASFPIVGYIEKANLATDVLQNDAKIIVIYADGFQSVHTASETSYEISSAEGLGAFRDSVNAGETYKGQTVKLTADIDLENEEWPPIGNSANKFMGTFDGQEKTISNLKINAPSTDAVGFFGSVESGNIKNLNVENAQVTGADKTGVVVGHQYTSGTMSNIKLTGLVQVNGKHYVGGVAGKTDYTSISTVTIDVEDGSYVKSTETGMDGDVKEHNVVGGVTSMMTEGAYSMSEVTSNIDVSGDSYRVGGIIGLTHKGNTITNCKSSGDVSITGSDDAEHVKQIGGIAGTWYNTDGTVTFTNCKFTGTLSATVNGNLFTDFLYDGLVGGQRSATGSGKLIIDGKEVVLSSVTTADDLKSALNSAKDNGQAIYIDAGGNDLGSLAGTTYPDNSVIKNAKVSAQSYGGNAQGTVTFIGCTFDNPSGAYSVHFDAGSAGSEVVFEDCTLAGWCSFGTAVGKVTLINCDIKGNSIYGLLRFYQDTELIGCTIDCSYANGEDGYPDGISAVNGATVTLTGCTITYADFEVAENAKIVVDGVTKAESIGYSEFVTKYGEW